MTSCGETNGTFRFGFPSKEGAHLPVAFCHFVFSLLILLVPSGSTFLFFFLGRECGFGHELGGGGCTLFSLSSSVMLWERLRDIPA